MRRWWLSWPLVVGLVLVTIVLSLVGWLHSEHDLRAFDARAKSLGIATTWADLGLTESPEPELAGWRRLHALAEQVKSYQLHAEWRFPQPGQPIDPELAAHHDHQPPKAANELLDLIEDLDGVTVVAWDKQDFPSPFVDMPLSTSRDLSRLCAERFLLAPLPAMIAEARRGAYVILATKPHTLIEGLVQISQAAIWHQSVRARLDTPYLDRIALAELSERIRDHIVGSMDSILLGELVFQRALIVEAVNKVDWDLAGSLGLPAWTAHVGLDRLVYRAGRRHTLDLMLDAVVAARARPSTIGLRSTLAHLTAPIHTAQWWDAGARVAAATLPSLTMVVDSIAKFEADMSVLAAELRGTPWPVDPTDPSGGPVRRIERDGRLIGYYLLGRNGVDDGGDQRQDVCRALYAPLGSPKASDPPKP